MTDAEVDAILAAHGLVRVPGPVLPPFELEEPIGRTPIDEMFQDVTGTPFPELTFGDPAVEDDLRLVFAVPREGPELVRAFILSAALKTIVGEQD